MLPRGGAHALVERLSQRDNVFDIYFSTAPLTQMKRIEPKAGQTFRPFEVPLRAQGTEAPRNSIVVDLDVKTGAYGSTSEALGAMRAFIAAAGLPRLSQIVLSGKRAVADTRGKIEIACHKTFVTVSGLPVPGYEQHTEVEDITEVLAELTDMMKHGKKAAKKRDKLQEASLEWNANQFWNGGLPADLGLPPADERPDDPNAPINRVCRLAEVALQLAAMGEGNPFAGDAGHINLWRVCCFVADDHPEHTDLIGDIFYSASEMSGNDSFDNQRTWEVRRVPKIFNRIQPR